FTADLCKLFIIANIAWYALEIPFFCYFFLKWISPANLPGQKELSGCMLNEEAAKVTDHMRLEVKGHYATGQSDGWKNISKDHIIATIINAEYMTYLVNTVCVTKERKTVENLLEIVLNQIKYFTEVLQVTIVAWCTDAASNGLKMWCLLVEQMPWIFAMDCWAHQIHFLFITQAINLVMSDLFKGAADLFKDLLNDALEIIKWFNNHTWALGMLKDTMATKIGKVLCLILPVITCWMSHYLSVQQLIKVEHAFRQLLPDKEDDLVKCARDKEEAQEKAMQIIAKLQPPFFHKLR
ncbi:hypothetical protein DAEQUDRAFT_681006, partial [Daedalea quercina L-15889]